MTADDPATARTDPPPCRVVIEGVQPAIDGGRYAAKGTAGRMVEVTADIFTDGHDRLAAVVRHRRAAGDWCEVPMTELGNDRWRAAFPVPEVGLYEFTVEAWVDRFATWRHGLEKKFEAGQSVSSELLEGAVLVRDAARRASGPDAALLGEAAATLGGSAAQPGDGLADALAETMQRHPDRANSARLPDALRVDVERERAAWGAWYEMFPRSASAEPGRRGTFTDVEKRLPYVAAMGFDVLYLPPIHPIGRTHRKGPNNSPSSKPGDPGSPWGIGGAEGGHTAVHPELGTLDDFDHLVQRASAHGIEIALDIAFQCSPDHPWVREHPEWFRHRPDGSIHYAENPPKKYQDIYPLDFETAAWRELWQALLDVVLFWADHGVRIFRVDNPHTKAFRFWEWMIAEARSRHPDLIFLAEAFTRPRVMQHLARSGFSQSYSYFTWRNTKQELTEYFTELHRTPLRYAMRPNLFANTPDILHEFLQTGGPAAFRLRLVLAATLAGNYGIYGPPFELCVGSGMPGSEEYRDSEKYEVRHWDLEAPQSLSALVTRVNEIRRNSPALRHDETIEFHPVDNDNLLFFSKHDPNGDERILVVVNLDPRHAQSGFVDLPIELLGVNEDEAYLVHDLIGDARYTWTGRRNYVALDPDAQPAHVLRARRVPAKEAAQRTRPTGEK